MGFRATKRCPGGLAAARTRLPLRADRFPGQVGLPRGLVPVLGERLHELLG